MASKPRTSRKLLAAIAVAAVVVVVAGTMFACAPRVMENAPHKSETATTSTATATQVTGEPNFAAPTTIPEADMFGVITAASWADQYPLQYESYLMTGSNVPLEYGEWTAAGNVDEKAIGLEYAGDLSSVKVDYLADDQYPEIKTLGKGYGYAKYYTEPAGHAYALWVIEHNGRLGDMTTTKGKLSCYTCKTPQIHFYVASEGAQAWTASATEGLSLFTENISCSNCHVNDNPTQLQVLRADWIRAMGDDASKVSLEGQVCGQCHCDYSMAPASTDGSNGFDAGEPTSPYYGGLDSMTPENAMKFYDEYGFSDWTYASTGAQMLAIRHAEFEFNYANGQNPMVKMGYDCSDCHMGRAVSEDGTVYSNHNLRSPLDDPELLASCNVCHTDLVTEVRDLQADIDGRTHELGLRAERFIHNFEAKVAVETTDDAGNTVLMFDDTLATAQANGLSADDVAELQRLQRYACYYWNLAAAENSEGAHNPNFFNELIDEGNALLDQADAILGVSSVA